jgi:LacI family transcriptional regulator
LSLGHRSFGVIIGNPAKNDRMETRLQGIRAALGRAGITLNPDNIVFSGYSIEDGRQGCAELFARGSHPTAILAGNDILGLGILLECMHRGIAVPDELSIMGFGDAPIAANFIPPMSTVRISSSEVGVAIADYLVARAEGREGTLPPVDLQLLPRGTTAPPRMLAASKGAAAARPLAATPRAKSDTPRPPKR